MVSIREGWEVNLESFAEYKRQLVYSILINKNTKIEISWSSISNYNWTQTNRSISFNGCIKTSTIWIAFGSLGKK